MTVATENTCLVLKYDGIKMKKKPELALYAIVEADRKKRKQLITRTRYERSVVLIKSDCDPYGPLQEFGHVGRTRALIRFNHSSLSSMHESIYSPFDRIGFKYPNAMNKQTKKDSNNRAGRSSSLVICTRNQEQGNSEHIHSHISIEMNLLMLLIFVVLLIYSSYGVAFVSFAVRFAIIWTLDQSEQMHWTFAIQGKKTFFSANNRIMVIKNGKITPIQTTQRARPFTVRPVNASVRASYYLWSGALTETTVLAFLVGNLNLDLWPTNLIDTSTNS